MCYSPDEFAGMTIVRVIEHSVDDTLPRAPRFACFKGFIIDDVVEEWWWTVTGGVHSEIQTAFPFQKADFVRRADPRLLKEGGEENRAVDAVHIVEIELDSLRRVLGTAREVHYYPVSHPEHTNLHEGVTCLPAALCISAVFSPSSSGLTVHWLAYLIISSLARIRMPSRILLSSSQ